MKTMVHYFFMVLFLAFSGSLKSFCQKNDMKFGQIDKENLAMTVYDKDTSASAVVLGDYGDVTFHYLQADGNWYINFTRHRRIKILKKSGYEWANHQILLYDKGNISESVSALKGFTYNLVDGKIEKEKLTKKSQFREEVSEYYNALKFTMPNIREGSIIEYNYTIKSDYLFQLPSWQFQYSIPVAWSEYNVTIPEYFIYKQLMKGYEPLAVNEKTTGNGRIMLTDVDRTYDRSGVQSQYAQNNIEFRTEIYRFVAKDMPAFIEEPMLTTADSYKASIDFELSILQMPNSVMRNFTATWESINKSLLDHENFGGQLSGGIFLNDEVERITLNYEEPFDRMHAVYHFVQNHMKWNNSNGKYASTSLRNAYNDKGGNVADVNLLLTLMLRKVGLNANPVILSIRSNGIVNPAYPMQTQFNYVIAQVTIDGKIYLLDATDPLCPLDLLPVRCLNGSGRLICEKGTDWVSLKPNKSYDYACTANLNLDPKGLMTGTMVIDRDDYAAYRLRKNLESEKSMEKYIESLENAHNGLTIESYSHVNIDSIYYPVREEYNVTIEDNARVTSDFIYFNPLLYEKIEANPFKLQERKYPVDYSYARHEKYKVTINIPQDYQVEEAPDPIHLTLPDKSAVFKYKISVEENKIHLESDFSINKSVFLFSEYLVLKEFYDKMVEKHAEQVVLKKIID